MDMTQMSAKHPYRAEEVNYYTNDWPMKWETANDFLDEFEDADMDYNFVYRWDITPYFDAALDEEIPGRYSAQITMILQRKGIYAPNVIEEIAEEELPRLIAYLHKHWEYMIEMWAPISNTIKGKL